MMETMKAVVYEKVSKPTRLVYREVEKPVPAADQVLIRVEAVSVNAADYRSMKMGIIPRKRIFGADMAGCVVAVGSNCHQFKVGDEVIGELSAYGFGGFAEYALAPEKALVFKPAALSAGAAAALPISGVTALQALRDKGNIQKGQQVLIYGGAGGVGTFSIQLAKLFGATVTVVCGTRHMDQTISLGADKAIDYTKEDCLNSENQFDLILAVNGGRRFNDYKRALKPGGRVVVVGGPLSQVFNSLLFSWFFSLGSKKIITLAAKSNQQDLSFIASLAADGAIRPVIDRYYSLDRVPEVVAYASEGHADGKVIITSL